MLSKTETRTDKVSKVVVRRNWNGDPSYHELRINGQMVSTAWGYAEVDDFGTDWAGSHHGSRYLVTIFVNKGRTCDVFYHVDEVDIQVVT